MKTEFNGMCTILQDPEGEYLIFRGSLAQLNKYRIWLSQANHKKKSEYKILTHDAIFVVPEEENHGT